MPYRKRKNAVRRKRPARKNGKRKMKMYRAPRMGTGIAPYIFAKLKYVYQYSAAQGAPYHLLPFRGNSVYDPDYLTGGHQPMYFDQYMAIYDRYLVYASSIKVTVMNASSQSALQVILYPAETVSTLTSTSSILEQTNASAAVTVPLNQQSPSIIKRFAKTSRVLGYSKAQMGEEHLQGNASNNPTAQWFWNIYMESSDGATNLAGNALIEIKYFVKFFERKIQPQS